MHLSTKMLAFLGLLTAFAVLLIILSGIFDFNTLFLLAAASFCVGIAVREAGIRIGFGFFLASLLLGLFLAPNKLYCITYAAMGLYILIWELSYDRLLRVQNIGRRRKLHWTVKYITFNVMFLIMLIFFPKLFYEGSIGMQFMIPVFLAGQVILFVYDLAYTYFQRDLWGRVRGRLKLK